MDAYAAAACDAFQEVERVRLLLDKKEKALSHAVRVMAVQSDAESKAEYFDHTSRTMQYYEDKRAKL